MARAVPLVRQGFEFRGAVSLLLSLGLAGILASAATFVADFPTWLKVVVFVSLFCIVLAGCMAAWGAWCAREGASAAKSSLTVDRGSTRRLRVETHTFCRDLRAWETGQTSFSAMLVEQQGARFMQVQAAETDHERQRIAEATAMQQNTDAAQEWNRRALEFQAYFGGRALALVNEYDRRHMVGTTPSTTKFRWMIETANAAMLANELEALAHQL